MSQTQDNSRKKAVEQAISHIEKQFGEGAIMTLGKHSANREVSVIKTGAIALDAAHAPPRSQLQQEADWE